MSDYKIGTKCIQSGWSPKNGEPRALPIYQSTTFKYESSDEMGALFDLEKSGWFYSRLQNPTCDYVAAKIADMEGGVAGQLTSSGQAANFYAIFNICESGDHFITSADIYGGTYNLFNVTMRKLGIRCTFLGNDATPEEIQAAFQPNTKCIFGETISNPTVKIYDFEKWADIAHKNGVPLIIDNTFATPVNCRPFKWGADIVTHSTTKYLDGHALSVGGCIVDSGNFDWSKYAEKFPGLTTPDDSYHGLIYTEKFGKGAYITKSVSQLMRDLGSMQSPQNAFLINAGIETLELRMQRHVENARKCAAFLKKSGHLSWINFSELEDDPYHELQQKYMPGGTCGVMCFGLEGDRATAVKFMDSLKMISIETHVADSKSCVLHPASHTHRQLSDEQLKEAGIQPDLIRFSVGLEDAEDIIADLDQALKATFG